MSDTREQAMPANTTVAGMTDNEVVAHILGDSLLNRVRRIVSAYVGRCEQRALQPRPCSPVETRREELMVAEKIITTVRAE